MFDRCEFDVLVTEEFVETEVESKHSRTKIRKNMKMKTVKTVNE